MGRPLGSIETKRPEIGTSSHASVPNISAATVPLWHKQTFPLADMRPGELQELTETDTLT